ncbi:hypothetical protein SAMN05878281_1086 [Salegentibacter salegens]|uniref:Uncharacterized protein n=1 Tax=Salegentibacter salegens TaxID=143223 RepID=A0A1M7JRS1_9FLAO|nr:hypothetical protein SAMN05878281_1086 [Salegentibacter salegens]
MLLVKDELHGSLLNKKNPGRPKPTGMLTTN